MFTDDGKGECRSLGAPYIFPVWCFPSRFLLRNNIQLSAGKTYARSFTRKSQPNKQTSSNIDTTVSRRVMDGLVLARTSPDVVSVYIIYSSSCDLAREHRVTLRRTAIHHSLDVVARLTDVWLKTALNERYIVCKAHVLPVRKRSSTRLLTALVEKRVYATNCVYEVFTLYSTA